MSLKIVALRAENVKRLSAVEIQANGAPVVVVAGDNEAGKSSVLDAIAMALGGKALVPPQPIRKGKKRAEIELDLGDFIVTRVFTETGGSLTVTNPKDGAKYPSPQALLDGLVGRLTFDPLAFVEQDEKAQAETLRGLAGIDTSDLELERKRLYEERTLVNRDVTQLQGAVNKAVHHPDVGLVSQDPAAISQALNEADVKADQVARVQSAAVVAASGVTMAREKARRCAEAVDRARQALEDAETASLEADETMHEAVRVEAEAKSDAERAVATVPDRSGLRQQLADIDAYNNKVRDNKTRAELRDRLTERRDASDKLTERLNDIDLEKADRLAVASFPVQGLGLDDTVGVTWNGLPFSQASSAVRVRVSVAIGLALNPKLRVLLVRNGNDLGAKNLQLIAEMAEESGAQLWIERISGGDGLPTIVIEDGAVLTASTFRESVRA